ncbi:hypothetical protein VMF7928_01478 [Vibrio marisflavi CECT 7928]|uniref:Lipoprotein n=2 Tax=Vibrio marisflavi TaxID=1216040 RepID=A0ABM9A2H7_9VIBR|nr:hypothetical protein VMF7928_01478 [Vibrio marisflavi CECT 7928]
MKLAKALVISLFVLTGCTSKEKESVPPSKAYSIANQTYLIHDYQVLWSTNKSKLKDYSQEDIAKINDALNKRSSSGGNLSVAFGVLRILSGNFTGAIDVVGGTASNIAKSNHPSKYSNWYAAIPKASATDGLDATRKVAAEIQKEAMTILNEHGVYLELKVIEPERKSMIGATIYRKTAYFIAGTDIRYGFYSNDFYLNYKKSSMEEGHTSFIEAKDQWVTSFDTRYAGTGGMFNAKYFRDHDIEPFNRTNGFDLFMAELTSRLPDSYFYYQAPSSTHPIPSIYKNGEKLMFIQPNVVGDNADKLALK